jgi:hypothetical protein
MRLIGNCRNHPLDRFEAVNRARKRINRPGQKSARPVVLLPPTEMKTLGVYYLFYVILGVQVQFGVNY